MLSISALSQLKRLRLFILVALGCSITIGVAAQDETPKKAEVAKAIHSASFDCAKAVTKTEHLICSDPGLSEMDSELDNSYRKARESERLLNNKDRLREYQAVWLRDIRNRCSDLECLKAVYEQRIMQLKVPLQPDNCAGADQGDMGSIATCSGSEWLMEEDYLSNLILILTKTQVDSKTLNFEKKQPAWRKNFECHCLGKADGYTAGSLGPAMVLGCRLEEVKIRIAEVRRILNGAPVNFGGNSPPPGSYRQKDVNDQ